MKPTLKHLYRSIITCIKLWTITAQKWTFVITISIFCLFVVFLSLLHIIKYHIKTCGASDYTVFGSVSVKTINSANSFSYLFCLKLSGKLILSQHWGRSGKMWEKTNYHDRKILESCLVSGECLPGNAALHFLPGPWGGWTFYPFSTGRNLTFVPFSFSYSSWLWHRE